MKRFFFLAGLTIAALSLAGCQRETEFTDSRDTKMEIILNLEESRTVNDGLSTRWVNGDVLSVTYAPARTTEYSQNTPFTVTDAENGRASGNVQLTENSYDWYFVYPYTTGAELPSSAGPFLIGGSSQTQTGNSDRRHLAGENMPLYGVNYDVSNDRELNVSMSQMASVLAVDITNGLDGAIKVKRVTFTTPSDIVGSYYVDYRWSPVDQSVFSPSDPSLVSSSATLTVQDGAPIAKGQDAKFYLVIKPSLFYSGTRFTLTVEAEMNGETHIDTKHLDLRDATFFKAGHIKDLNFTFDERDSRVRETLMAFFNAMDGPNWIHKDYWGTDVDWEDWEGVTFEKTTGKIGLTFAGVGLKGEIPDCIGDFGDMLYSFQVINETDLTGTFPASFAKLTSLEHLTIATTSMTSLRDVFANMKSLRHVQVFNNEMMAGPMPLTIGDSPVLENLFVNSNRLTGELQASWARLGVGHFAFTNNCLTGKIPQTFLELDNYQKGLQNLLWQKTGYGFDISEIDIQGYQCWPSGEIEDLDGNRFSFQDVIGKNKYTVYISWAPWCPYSKELMPQLRDYYNKYNQDGLEVIATVMLTSTGGIWKDNEAQQEEILAKGYDQWYNFSWWDASHGSEYMPATPTAEVYDADGYILFSSFSTLPDPVRNRFGKVASADLIPFLESLLGPAEEPDLYESTDYSKDGEVLTLQKATAGNGINIVFMGDGYTDRDMGDGGLYETLMNQAMEEFFAIEPYKTFRNRFNVYAVKVVSKNGRVGEGYTTALSSYFGYGSNMGGNDDLCYEYALKVPGISDRNNLLVSVLVNARRHGGTTYMYGSTQSSVAYTSSFGNDRDLYGPVLRHESGGHGFAFLADEYVQYSGAAPANHVAKYNEMYDKYGWYGNVDFTSDPSKIRWSTFLADQRYAGEVGVFEGGALYEKGAYRPSMNSMMNENFEYHNAPSRWIIYQQIMKRSGESYNFNTFIEYDAVNRAAGAHAPAKKSPKDATRFEPTAPPVILP